MGESGEFQLETKKLDASQIGCADQLVNCNRNTDCAMDDNNTKMTDQMEGELNIALASGDQ